MSAKSIIISTGVQYRRLPIERLSDFEGAGIYYAATETESRLCKDQDVIIVGGGNSAGQAAMYLCRGARHVHILIRGSSLASSMSDYLLSRIEAEQKISIHFNTEIDQLVGDKHLEQVILKNKKDSFAIKSAAVFVMVGAAPNTKWISEMVNLDEKGFVLTGKSADKDSSFETSCAGIFAVGDVRSGSVKRVASAVGEGSVVVSEVWQYLNSY